MSGTFNFAEAFKALTGFAPFPWQTRLFEQMSAGELPSAVDIPTGLGKTAVMALWLLARAAGADLPRRLVYVVDRRAVVDQATTFAEDIRTALRPPACPAIEQVRQGLALGDRPLAISTLRGKYVDNREWLDDPTAPAIIVGTVDMIGSRLLFEGYGVSRRMRPYAAGLMGCDTLVMLDEAHLSRPFERLLWSIEDGQRVPAADHVEQRRGCFAGTRADARCPPRLRVLPLSATLGFASGSERPFALDHKDRANKIVRTRLEAAKSLTIDDLGAKAQLEDVLAERAWGLMRKGGDAVPRSFRTLIYCDSRKVAEKVASALQKRAKEEAVDTEVILFVGGRRLHERQEAARQLEEHGLIAGSESAPNVPIFLVATSAGEVGVDLDADHMVCDLVAWERMVQRLGRVNRRGKGAARVLVIDQGPPEKKQAGEVGIVRHMTVRQLLETLPRDGTGGYRAGPAALEEMGQDPKLQVQIRNASTPPPLYPALTRPLVDAWAMTSLSEHTGRPEPGPWLRGWVDEEPQTTVVWRRFLPVYFEETGTGIRIVDRKDNEINEFFEAAPLQGAELLEIETKQVVGWLKRRAQKRLNKPSDRETGEQSDASTSAPDSVHLPPLNSDAPVAFLLDSSGKFKRTFSFNDIAGEELNQSLAGRTLVVDARISGIKEGLLNPSHEIPASTIEDNWGEPKAWEEVTTGGTLELGVAEIRVRALPYESRDKLMYERQRSPNPWQEVLALPLQGPTEGGSPTTWLIVEKLRGGETDEDSRSTASALQCLDEHQAWAAREAVRIAKNLGLPEQDRSMLAAATLHHDDGKKASCWQRAFNAPSDGGPYAKTPGPLNRKVLKGYRHEFQSLLDAEKSGLDGLDDSDSQFDLALHLIAAHHGRARPTIEIKGCDSLPPTAAARRAQEVALRFARLQRQWGPWGLAWWEALLRAADQRASRALEETVLREERKDSSKHASSPASREPQADLFLGAKETR